MPVGRQTLTVTIYVGDFTQFHGYQRSQQVVQIISKNREGLAPHPDKEVPKYMLNHLRQLRSASLTIVATVAALSASAASSARQTIDGWAPGTKFQVDPTFKEALNTGCRFGFAMSMTEDYAVIGAPDVRLVDLKTTSGSNGAGAAFVFKRTAGTNQWSFVQRLIAPTRTLAQTGCSVAIDPVTNDIVVGAWGYDAVALFGGSAFVYKKGVGDSWGYANPGGGAGPAGVSTAERYGPYTRLPDQTLAPADLQQIDQFGFSVAAHDGTVAVGCPLSGTSNTGAIYVFERDGDGTYAQTQKIEDLDGGANDQLGTRLSLHGDLLAAGVQNKNIQGKIHAGNTRVYSRAAGASAWTLSSKLTEEIPTANAGFGASVAVVDGADAAWLLVGAPARDSGNTEAVTGNGIAYMFRSDDHGITWSLDGTLLPRSDNVNNAFGYAVALSLTDPPQAIVGAPGFDTAVVDPNNAPDLLQVANSGTAFAFTRGGAGGTWAIRGTVGNTGDLWSWRISANSNIGRAVATAPTTLTYSIAGAETPTSSLGTTYPFVFTNGRIGTGVGEVAGPASGQLDADGNPNDGSRPGDGGGSTGGTVNGGGTPSTGDGSASPVIPLTPIVYSWGTIKGSAVTLKNGKISILQTDGKHSGVKPKYQKLGTLPAGARYVGTIDMNGDRSGDIVFVDSNEVLRYWKRDANKILSTNVVDELPTGYDAIAVGDFNADSKPDVLLRSVLDPSQITIWHISAGAITGADDYELPDGEWILLTGNFRNKNNNDILLREQATGELRVFVPLADDADGTSNSEATPITTISPSYKLKAVADMNGDGQSDLVWQGSEILIELMDKDTNGDYVKLSRQRVGFASGTVVNARDWNDDGQVDLMMRRGNRTYYQYLKLTNGYLYGGGSRDLGNAPGPVQDISQR